MTRINNPRFPHTCKIYRIVLVSKDVNLTDSEGEHIQDSTGKYLVVTKEFSKGNARTDVVIAEDPDTDEYDQTQAAAVLSYEGKCRSYDHDTTSDRGDVITQVRILALPVKQDEWTADTVPQKGDRVQVDKISFKEWGTVIDVRPNNLGTNVLWRYND